MFHIKSSHLHLISIIFCYKRKKIDVYIYINSISQTLNKFSKICFRMFKQIPNVFHQYSLLARIKIFTTPYKIFLETSRYLHIPSTYPPKHWNLHLSIISYILFNVTSFTGGAFILN